MRPATSGSTDPDASKEPGLTTPVFRSYVDLRGIESKYSRVVTYAVFFDNNDYKGLRLSVILDDCEKQDYRPVP
jgi:hypothetical protein